MADIVYTTDVDHHVTMGDDNFIVSASMSGTGSGLSWHNVMDYSATKDGSTDDATAIQAAVDACEAAGGGVVFFPPGSYASESTITIDTGNVRLEGYGATMVVSYTVTPAIEFDTVDNCGVYGLTCLGDETYAGYPIDAAGESYPFVSADTCDGFTAKDLKTSARSGGVFLTACTNGTVDNVYVKGFLTSQKTANGTAAIEVTGGCENISVTNCKATDHGECVLVGGASQYVNISNCQAKDIRDNGFYISSGDYCTVTGCTVDVCTYSTGIKARGSYNVINGNAINGCIAGVGITPYSVGTPDADDVIGWGNVVSDNTIESCTTYGISVEDYLDTHLTRNNTISGNTIIGTPSTSGGVPIRLTSLSENRSPTPDDDTVSAIGSIISGNSIYYDTAEVCAAGIYLDGAASDAPITGCVVTGNSITGNSTNLTYGIAGNYVVNNAIYGNIYRNIGTANVESDASWSGNVLNNLGAAVATDSGTIKTSSWPMGLNASAGTLYTGGFYLFGAAADDFNPAITLGTADGTYAAHVMFVAAAGATDTVITVTGTSITDAGVRTTSDSEEVAIDNASLNTYYETSLKWIGQVSIEKTAGTDRLCNYGFCKYWDNANVDFTITAVECLWEAAKTDAGFNIVGYYHKSTNWTYAAGAAPTPPAFTSLVSVCVDESSTIAGQPGAFKVTGIDTAISGSASEGIIFGITTGTTNVLDQGSIQIWYTE